MSGEPIRYPWDKWFEKIKERGKKLLLKRGVDYNCMTHSMYIQIRQAARHRGIKISCQTREGGNALEVRRKDA